MAVIGRLDDQVNKVLITPLERGREDEEAPGPPPASEESEEEARESETSLPRAELPVWLL